MYEVYLNLDLLESIRIKPARKCGYINWREEKKSLWKTTKAGFLVSTFWDEFLLSPEDILKKFQNVFIENQVVYEEPYLLFRMASGAEHQRYFKNQLEIQKFLDEYPNLVPSIENKQWLSLF